MMIEKEQTKPERRASHKNNNNYDDHNNNTNSQSVQEGLDRRLHNESILYQYVLDMRLSTNGTKENHTALDLRKQYCKLVKNNARIMWQVIAHPVSYTAVTPISTTLSSFPQS